MITISIGPERRTIDEADEAGITQQINRRRSDGAVVCVQVQIREADVNMTLATPTCAGGPGGRPPNARERQIFELWAQRGLDQTDFTGGGVVAFLRQVRRLL